MPIVQKVGVSVHFFYSKNFFSISKVIKKKTFLALQKFIFQINAVIFPLKKNDSSFHKNIKHELIYHSIVEMFVDHQISKLEWFLKDYVTLKTGVMATEN